MKLSKKATIATVAVVLVLLAVVIVFVVVNRIQSTPPEDTAENPALVRDDSHVMDDGGSDAVTVVEFLDFECEACGAFYPLVEDLRSRYEGQITYVIRYFPLPGHFNSKNAAIAAEAAAQQGRLEEMYNLLLQTQGQWGEAQESRADLFRTYAEDLGLDMAAFDKAVADPATAERVESDIADGKSLGVSSTPTFFVDGEQLVLERYGDLEASIRSALDGEPGS